MCPLFNKGPPGSSAQAVAGKWNLNQVERQAYAMEESHVVYSEAVACVDVTMRLLHTIELRFEEFFDSSVPADAILSHRWAGDEVSYHDFLQGKKTAGQGYAKILAACALAAKDTTAYHGDIGRSLHWIWIDTCCIDKSSSAELSEAINSMYRWYQKSTICYAHLSDVVIDNDRSDLQQMIRDSQWFTRGWTLQELLAPRQVAFYEKGWEFLGMRSDLVTEISSATGIHAVRIMGFHKQHPLRISVAEKFSWIASRETSRTEDRAYCLLGLFDVNLPLLYGEGKKAFRRLQLEILRTSSDESIFLWDLSLDWSSSFSGSLRSKIWRNLDDLTAGLNTGLLTPDPARYGNLRSKDLMNSRRIYGIRRPPYTVTNQGLELLVPSVFAQRTEFYMPLNYTYAEGSQQMGVYAIVLQRQNPADRDGDWFRAFPTMSCLQERLPKLPAVHFDSEVSAGLFIAPEEWVWNRQQLASIETTTIHVRL